MVYIYICGYIGYKHFDLDINFDFILAGRNDLMSFSFDDRFVMNRE